jgi:hypothetical protein
MAKQPSDGELADRAFKQQADPVGPAASKPPQEPGEAVPPVTTQREPQGPPPDRSPVPPIEATGGGE